MGRGYGSAVLNLLRSIIIFLLRFLIFLSYFLFYFYTQAQEKDLVSFSADKLTRDLDKKLVSLEGHVQVVFRGYHLQAEKMVLNLKDKTIQASGHVVLQSLNSRVEAERVEYDYGQETGVFYSAKVKFDRILISSKEIRKLGPDEFTARGFRYTTCTTCPPVWSFSGQKIHTRLGGYTYIQLPVLRLGGVPSFALPALWLPSLNRRQSGLLAPIFDFSYSGGWGINQQYFWAINPSHDLTVSAKVYEKRGWQGLLEYRYALTEFNKGQFFGGLIRDSNLTGMGSSNSDIKALNRGFFSSDLYQTIGEKLDRTHPN